MKSSKDTARLDEMLDYFNASKRSGGAAGGGGGVSGGGDRPDRGERAEKVAEYLKHLQLEDSEDDSSSSEDKMQGASKGGKKKSGSNFMTDFQEMMDSSKKMKKKKAGKGGGKGNKKNKGSESDSTSSLGTSSESTDSSEDEDESLSLSDVSTDSPNEGDDPFASGRNRGVKLSNRKPKFDDVGKMPGSELLERFRRAETDMKARVPMSSSSKEMKARMEKKPANPKVMPGPAGENPKLKKKNQYGGKSSSDTDMSPEQEFLKYLQSAKGRKVLENVGKKLDLSSLPKELLDERANEMGRRKTMPKTGPTPKMGMATTSTGGRQQVTEPSRTLGRKVAPKEPTLNKMPPILSMNPSAMSKLLQKDLGKARGDMLMKEPTFPMGMPKIPLVTSREPKTAAAAAMASTSKFNSANPTKSTGESSAKKTLKRGPLTKK